MLGQFHVQNVFERVNHFARSSISVAFEAYDDKCSGIAGDCRMTGIKLSPHAEA